MEKRLENGVGIDDLVPTQKWSSHQEDLCWMRTAISLRTSLLFSPILWLKRDLATLFALFVKCFLKLVVYSPVVSIIKAESPRENTLVIFHPILHSHYTHTYFHENFPQNAIDWFLSFDFGLKFEIRPTYIFVAFAFTDSVNRQEYLLYHKHRWSCAKHKNKMFGFPSRTTNYLM